MSPPVLTPPASTPAAIDLNRLRIASPCPASWDAMEGDERRRFCAACKLNVYDLSHLSTAEAVALVTRHEGERMCLRLRRRADGTVITRDCPVGAARAARRRWFAIAAVAGLAGVAWSWLANRPPPPPAPPPPAPALPTSAATTFDDFDQAGDTSMGATADLEK